jgi:peptidoglycan/xylan/chitin deacetylase (PgdA/CDA1 family)
LNTNTLDAFEADILADEPILSRFMGTAGTADWHWLRFPFLREGDTPEKHHAILAFLKKHGYKVAEVTLNFDDYEYNEPYVRCLAKNDKQGMEWLRNSYLTAADNSLTQGRKSSMLLFGRQIKHIMLLHIGSFETVMFPQLLDLLRLRGYKLISLPEAASDPAFAVDPDLTGDWIETFLDQMLRAKHLPNSPSSEDRFAALDAICR